MKRTLAADQETYRRAVTAAVSGLLIQIALALGMTVLALYTRSLAVQAAAWHLYGGLPVWGVLALLYHQHRAERAQTLETQQLTETDPATAALFRDHDADLHHARRRLDRLYRWGLAATSAAVAVYLLSAGLMLGSRGYAAYETGALIQHSGRDGAVGSTVTIAASVAAFLAFIMARYVAGMTRVEPWRLLRGGAGYLIGSCLMTLLIVAGGIGLQTGHPTVMGYLGLAAPWLLVLLGLEIIAAQLTNVYRPRRAGETARPAFDSRLLSWLTNPESIAVAINEAVNYQFGFQVSRSWFYQLLGRAVTPLFVFGLLTLMALSCLVVVAPHEQAIVTRFGRIVLNEQQTGDAVLGPGLSFKLPWPISRAEKYPVGRIQQIMIGSATDPVDADKAVLWTHKHVENEKYLITAPTPWGHPRSGGAPAGFDPDRGASGISLLGSQMIVQYRVTDLPRYARSSPHPRELLGMIATRRLNADFAKKDIDTLLGPGRTVACQQLLHQIQHDAESYEMGVEVLFVGLVGVHPPADQGVAAAFLEQIDALQESHSMIEQAKQEAIETLSSVAGSPQSARQIDRAISQLQEDRAQGEQATHPRVSQDVQRREAQIESLIVASGGQAGQVIDTARTRRWQRVVSEHAKAQRFAAEVVAYRNAPGYYRQKQYLDALAEGLAQARKYIMAVDQGVPPVFRLDLKDAGSAVDRLFDTQD